MKKVILIIVAVAVLALAYVTVQSVLAPVSFDKKQQEIELVLQKQLKKIATYEDAYKSVYDKYADKDELVNFLNNGRVFYIRAEGDYTRACPKRMLLVAASSVVIRSGSALRTHCSRTAPTWLSSSPSQALTLRSRS